MNKVQAFARESKKFRPDEVTGQRPGKSPGGLKQALTTG